MNAGEIHIGQGTGIARVRFGARVRIARVTRPDLLEHGRFIGKAGTLARYIKRRKICVVSVDGERERECFPQNLEAI